MRGRARATGIVLLVCGVLAPAARGQITIEDQKRFVMDRAGIVDARVERQLETWLEELEQNKPMKDWTPSRDGGPRTLTREDIKL